MISNAALSEMILRGKTGGYDSDSSFDNYDLDVFGGRVFFDDVLNNISSDVSYMGGGYDSDIKSDMSDDDSDESYTGGGAIKDMFNAMFSDPAPQNVISNIAVSNIIEEVSDVIGGKENEAEEIWIISDISSDDSLDEDYQRTINHTQINQQNERGGASSSEKDQDSQRICFCCDDCDITKKDLKKGGNKNGKTTCGCCEDCGGDEKDCGCDTCEKDCGCDTCEKDGGEEDGGCDTCEKDGGEEESGEERDIGGDTPPDEIEELYASEGGLKSNVSVDSDVMSDISEADTTSHDLEESDYASDISDEVKSEAEYKEQDEEYIVGGDEALSDTQQNERLKEKKEIFSKNPRLVLLKEKLPEIPS